MSKLFEPDNIREHESIKIIAKTMGGIDGLLKTLKTSVKRGISQSPEEIEDRKNHFGRNNPPMRNTTSIFDMIIECFEDLML